MFLNLPLFCPIKPLFFSFFFFSFICSFLKSSFHTSFSPPPSIRFRIQQQVSKLAGNPLANLAALGLGGLSGSSGASSMNASGNNLDTVERQLKSHKT